MGRCHRPLRRRTHARARRMADSSKGGGHPPNTDRRGRLVTTGEFAQRYGSWAVIAGASEGVGASLADQLASRGLHLLLIARNEAKLKRLADDVRERHGVEVRLAVLDLTMPDIAERVAEAADGLDV